jgi:hypothetical protein
LNFDSELELNRVWFVVLCQCKRHWFNRVPGALDLKRGYVAPDLVRPDRLPLGKD